MTGGSIELDTSEPPRKKVRKGTKSCWECKRRKVRCIFAAHEDVTCDGCKLRKTTCIGQEFPDCPERPAVVGNRSRSGSVSSKRQAGDRLGRVEALVEQLVKNAGINGVHGPDISSNLLLERRLVAQGTAERPRSPPTRCTSNRNAADTHGSVTPAIISPPQERRNTRLTNKYDELSEALLQAWPSSRDLDLFLSVPAGSSGLLNLHKIHCMPYSGGTATRRHEQRASSSPSPRDILETPQRGSHPVPLARKLLLLAIFLQGIHPCAARDLQAKGLSASHGEIMSRAVEAATRLVTADDELVGSIEGIECIMLESAFQDNAGNLRRSWIAARRAMVMAQMMGLHRAGVDADSPSVKMLEPQTRARTDPERIWLRLVQSDRYLSLMLGLPQGSLENAFDLAPQRALDRRTPVERMRLLDTVAAGRMLQRRSVLDGDGLAATREIDELLLQASACMPARWWLAPELLRPAARPDEDAGEDGAEREPVGALRLDETVRMMDQLAHYHLVAQLHLPYLLRSPTPPEPPAAAADRGREHSSRIVAVNASREVLARFVAFRAAHPVGSSCRGVDFLAFVATTALCLAHMDGRHQRRARDGADVGGGSGLAFLTHQRPGDRAMMERALECMEHMAGAGADVVASNIATVLRHLLAVEADDGGDSCYMADPSLGAVGLGREGEEETEGEEPDHHRQRLECSGRVSDGGRVLRIYIPYFGTVKIERTGVSRYVPPASTAPGPGSGVTSTPAVVGAPSNPGSAATVGPSLPPPDDFVFSGNGFAQESRLVVPELAAGADDWTLQGVDMAFFDSLIPRVGETAAAEESWAQWVNNEPAS